MKKKQKIIGSLILVVLIAAFSIAGYFISKSGSTDSKNMFIDTDSNADSKTNSKPQSSNVKNNSKDAEKITVEIRGEIKNPGIYTMKKGSRVKDLIDISGGFTEDADTDSIIQVTPLQDNMYVKINKKGAQPVGASGSTSMVSPGGKININTASKEQLKTIPGIGDATAQKIIDYREKNGMFNSIDDLKKVGRIGDKTIAKWKDKIDVK